MSLKKFMGGCGNSVSNHIASDGMRQRQCGYFQYSIIDKHWKHNK